MHLKYYHFNMWSIQTLSMGCFSFVLSLKASVYVTLTAHFDFDLATLQVFNGHVPLVAAAVDSRV